MDSCLSTNRGCFQPVSSSILPTPLLLEPHKMHLQVTADSAPGHGLCSVLFHFLFVHSVSIVLSPNPLILFSAHSNLRLILLLNFSLELVYFSSSRIYFLTAAAAALQTSVGSTWTGLHLFFCTPRPHIRPRTARLLYSVLRFPVSPLPLGTLLCPLYLHVHSCLIWFVCSFVCFYIHT